MNTISLSSHTVCVKGSIYVIRASHEVLMKRVVHVIRSFYALVGDPAVLIVLWSCGHVETTGTLRRVQHVCHAQAMQMYFIFS